MNLLDHYLTEKGEDRSLYICGCASLNLQGMTDRATQDVDVIAPEIDEILREASILTARKISASEQWLNNGPELLADILPEGWKSRVVQVFRGKSLTVYSLGRADLLITKLDAMANRDRDLVDIASMNPSKEELEKARDFVSTLDANEGYPAWVSRCVERILAYMEKE